MRRVILLLGVLAILWFTRHWVGDIVADIPLVAPVHGLVIGLIPSVGKVVGYVLLGLLAVLILSIVFLETLRLKRVNRESRKETRKDGPDKCEPPAASEPPAKAAPDGYKASGGGGLGSLILGAVVLVVLGGGAFMLLRSNVFRPAPIDWAVSIQPPPIARVSNDAHDCPTDLAIAGTRGFDVEPHGFIRVNWVKNKTYGTVDPVLIVKLPVFDANGNGVATVENWSDQVKTFACQSP